jgi:hypothetical protein
MIISFEIPQDHLDAVSQYLLTQQQLVVDPLTGSTVVKKLYADPADFLSQQVHNMLHSIVLQFPTDATRQQLQQIKQLQDALKESVKPSLVTT